VVGGIVVGRDVVDVLDGMGNVLDEFFFRFRTSHEDTILEIASVVLFEIAKCVCCFFSLWDPKAQIDLIPSELLLASHYVQAAECSDTDAIHLYPLEDPEIFRNDNSSEVGRERWKSYRMERHHIVHFEPFRRYSSA